MHGKPGNRAVQCGGHKLADRGSVVGLRPRPKKGTPQKPAVVILGSLAFMRIATSLQIKELRPKRKAAKFGSLASFGSLAPADPFRFRPARGYAWFGTKRIRPSPLGHQDDEGERVDRVPAPLGDQFAGGFVGHDF